MPGVEGILEVPYINWGWTNETGERDCLSYYWDKVNRTGDLITTNCEWEENVALWKCQYKDKNLGGGPLGPYNMYYYPAVGNHSKIHWGWSEESAPKLPASRGHYWICGPTAYTHLPFDWAGVCYIGLVHPKFFFLPGREGGHLGIRLYDSLSQDRPKRSLGISVASTGNANGWGNEWPPERIIQTYGPATWAQDGSWGYRTPIYILNRLIRLQAVVEIITNQTAEALDLLADQATQTREVVLQHRLVVDYLLAEEGRVCGKLNLSTCCVKIDDNGAVVKGITRDIRKLAHVAVQTWSSPFNTSWWSWFGSSWWKQILWFLLISISGVILLPICLPCMMQLITKLVQDALSKMIRLEKKAKGSV
ncbi:endogenous retrovirus group 3 member 1 Env polyprotein-like [Vombatus ursinus]|uniref:endogenous retrovirus group 3 member 1 Env polyprotein-like n=1 Tax=Vombatus ursinus TaxID=29139 RepID=UPI000FFCEF21|nr:endogenous retrovirus group 3 member 1 Env polyprotein-like [Vombatus ursinus]